MIALPLQPPQQPARMSQIINVTVDYFPSDIQAHCAATLEALAFYAAHRAEMTREQRVAFIRRLTVHMVCAHILYIAHTGLIINTGGICVVLCSALHDERIHPGP